MDKTGVKRLFSSGINKQQTTIKEETWSRGTIWRKPES